MDLPDWQTDISDHTDVQSVLGSSTTLANKFLIDALINNDGSNRSEKHTGADRRECQSVLPDVEVIFTDEDDWESLEEGEQHAECESVVDGVSQHDRLRSEHANWSEKSDGQ